MERRARSLLVASRRLITPSTSPEKLGGFRRKIGKATTLVPYFSPGIPKFHSYLSLVAGKLPSPAARSPTLESPLRNFNQFHHAKEPQTGSKYVFLQHEHKQCGNHHAPMVRRQVETTPRRWTQRYVRASSPHRRSRRYDRRCSACRPFRASQWSWKSHSAHPTMWSRRSTSGRAGNRVASRRKLRVLLEFAHRSHRFHCSGCRSRTGH